LIFSNLEIVFFCSPRRPARRNSPFLGLMDSLNFPRRNPSQSSPPIFLPLFSPFFFFSFFFDEIPSFPEPFRIFSFFSFGTGFRQTPPTFGVGYEMSRLLPDSFSTLLAFGFFQVSSSQSFLVQGFFPLIWLEAIDSFSFFCLCAGFHHDQSHLHSLFVFYTTGSVFQSFAPFE